MSAVKDKSFSGVLFALSAYGFWAFIPIYWKAVGHVAATEMLAHRIVWSLPFLAILLILTTQYHDVGAALRHPQSRRLLILTSVLLSANWLIFIWAIQAGRVLEVSLGYYINPLINVVLGILVLHERLRRWQIAAVLLAAAGVAYQTFQLGSVPWVSLALALLFGFYALLRKQIDVASLPGMTVETLFMLPFAVIYLIWLQFSGELAFVQFDTKTIWLAILAGPITIFPLWWVIIAAKRLNYATLGICQYIAPSGHFLLAVLVYKEAFGAHQLITFVCIWLALIIYSVDSLVEARRKPTLA